MGETQSAPPGTATIRDDAGDTVPLLVEKRFSIKRFFAVELPYVARVERWWTTKHIVMEGFLVILFVALLVAMSFTSFAFPIIMIVLGIYGVVRAIRGRYFRLILLSTHADFLLAHACCASCGYSLRGHIADARVEFVRCPECGAQWKRDRLTAPVTHDARRGAAR
jgi:predicted RNA-binding Zn-ribbon protein involved in translation (DUF1610 family)